MREHEPGQVASVFRQRGVNVQIIDAQQQFFDALSGLSDPEQKREAVTQTFYKHIFGDLVRKNQAKYLLQGTILTDVDETVARTATPTYIDFNTEKDLANRLTQEVPGVVSVTFNRTSKPPFTIEAI